MEVPVRESQSARMRMHNASNMMDSHLYGRGMEGRSRNVISQLIEKVIKLEIFMFL